MPGSPIPMPGMMSPPSKVSRASLEVRRSRRTVLAFLATPRAHTLACRTVGRPGMGSDATKLRSEVPHRLVSTRSTHSQKAAVGSTFILALVRAPKKARRSPTRHLSFTSFELNFV